MSNFKNLDFSLRDINLIFFSEHRTRVIDDESDYFNTDGNKWLAPKQRDILRAREQEVQLLIKSKCSIPKLIFFCPKLREKRHGTKRGIRVTLDFAGSLFTLSYFNCN